MSADVNRRVDYDAINHILATDDEVAPSSGFVGAVMDRVRVESAAPQPIPFPWRRAMPGILLVAGVFGWATWEAVHYAMEGTGQFVLRAPALSPVEMHFAEEAGWVALALAVSYGAWLFSMRMVRCSSWL